jgi:serine/threonine protein kinase
VNVPASVRGLVERYRELAALDRLANPEALRDEAGDHYPTFLRCIAAEGLVDDTIKDDTRTSFPRVISDFFLLEPVGSGGFGSVFKAVDLGLGRTVAIKVCKPLTKNAGEEKEKAQKLRDYFKRGARKMVDLAEQPTHAVTAYELGAVTIRIEFDDDVIEDELPFLAMEFLRGPSLRQVIESLPKPPFGQRHHDILAEASLVAPPGCDTVAFVERVAGLLVGPAEALHEYHLKQILHRDIKPENLIFDTGGRLRVTDFDLARRVDDGNHTGELGTSPYAPTEQLLGREDHRADLYALGVVLYELLTLQHPYPPGRVYDPTAQAQDPRRFVPALPDAICHVVMKAIARDKKDRYPSAAEFASALREIASGGTMASPRLASAPPRPKRRPILYALPVLIVAVVVALIASGFLKEEESTDAKNAARANRSEEDPQPRSDGDSHVQLPGSLASYAAKTGLTLPEAQSPAYPSVVDVDGLVHALLPRGRVRLIDLLELQAELESTPIAGRLILADSRGSTLREREFQGTAAQYRHPFPPAFRVVLEVGKTYRWGMRADGETSWSSFEVVPGPSVEEIDRVRSQFEDGEQRPREFFELLLLRRHGLHAAAFRGAMELGARWPKRHVYALAWHSLVDLGLGRHPVALRVIFRLKRTK